MPVCVLVEENKMGVGSRLVLGADHRLGWRAVHKVEVGVRWVVHTLAVRKAEPGVVLVVRKLELGVGRMLVVEREVGRKLVEMGVRWVGRMLVEPVDRRLALWPSVVHNFELVGHRLAVAVGHKSVPVAFGELGWAL